MGSPTGYALFTAAFLINLPFGGWRSFLPPLSWRWFLAIHLPIPLIFLLRRSAGYSAWFIPWLLVAAVAGQLIGARGVTAIRRRRARNSGAGTD